MRPKAVLVIALLLGGGLFFCISGEAADSENSTNARIYCLKNDAPYGTHGPIYVDRNGDGKIDWEVSGPGMMAEMTSCFKMDTKFDGYYDVEYCISYAITGKRTDWSTNIHERVPEIGKDFVRIKKPNWVNWPEQPAPNPAGDKKLPIQDNDRANTPRGRETNDANDAVSRSIRQANYINSGTTFLAAAVEYLTKYADELSIKPELLRANLHPATKPAGDAGEEYRLDEEKPDMENGMTVDFVQTYFGLPVENPATHLPQGVIVVDFDRMADGSWRVDGARADLLTGLVVKKAGQKSLKNLHKLDRKVLAKALGLSSASEYDPASIKITDRGWSICHYDVARRVVIGIGTSEVAPVDMPKMPKLELPPMDQRIDERQYYVLGCMSFTLGDRKGGKYSGLTFVEPETLSVLSVTITRM